MMGWPVSALDICHPSVKAQTGLRLAVTRSFSTALLRGPSASPHPSPQSHETCAPQDGKQWRHGSEVWKKVFWDWEMVLWLKALTVLSDDPGSIHGTHMAPHNCWKFQGYKALFWLNQHQACMWCTHAGKLPLHIK